MKMWQFWIILAAIYEAPHVPSDVATLGKFICLAGAAISGIYWMVKNNDPKI